MRAKATNRRDIAIIVQRYGPDIIGGAETHARMIAERLAATEKYNIEVMTTTSRTMQWDDHFPVGVESINGVRIRRFRTESPRSPWFPYLHQATKIKNNPYIARALPKKLVEAFESTWYRTQGPFCPSLIEAIRNRREQFAKFIFFTYLYFPTAVGLPLVQKRSILVPTLHRETALHNLGTKRVFESAATIFANTAIEQKLILQLDPRFSKKTSVVGVGIEVPARIANPPPPQTQYGLYLGRVGRAKGVHKLISAYRQLREKGRVDWDLYLVGERDEDLDIPRTLGIHFLGPVDETRKWLLIHQAAFIINPSIHESLSLTTLEALAAGRPVVLNGACPVFRSYTDNFSGVHLYNSDEGLPFVTNAAIATTCGDLERTRTDVLRRFSWSVVLDTYHRALEPL